MSPVVLDGWFNVGGTGFLSAGGQPQSSLSAPVGWEDGICDDGARKVFVHLAQHGSITEGEVTGMLGSPRAFRRFSLAFDDFAKSLPFKVRIEATVEGKRYVKDREA